VSRLAQALQRIQATALAGALLALASFALPLYVLRPNRVMPLGDLVSMQDLGAGAIACVAAWVMLAAVSVLPWRALRSWGVTLAAAAACAGTVHVLGAGSQPLVTGNDFARLDLAGGAWLVLLAIYVSLFAVHQEGRGRLLLAVAALLVSVGLTPLDHLGVLREYHAAAGEFHDQLARHLLLSLSAWPLAALIGFPLGVLAARNAFWEGPLLGIAGFLQTVPSVALFGLLLPLLSGYGRVFTVGGVAAVAAATVVLVLAGAALRRHGLGAVLLAPLGMAAAAGVLVLLPALGLALFQVMAEGPAWLFAVAGSSRLDRLGLHGLGIAPAVVALTAYGVLPILAGTHVGLRSVPASSVEAARGMGMSASQVFWGVEVPTAAPSLFEGLRSSLLLTIGLASVAVLVNAGGLGHFLMRGVEQAVPDLVLLGAVPVVALAVVADGALRWLGRRLTPKGLRP
jgi:osmoprotectant transport system permease protein